MGTIAMQCYRPVNFFSVSNIGISSVLHANLLYNGQGYVCSWKVPGVDQGTIVRLLNMLEPTIVLVVN